MLAQPTRARLFALLAQLRRAARTTELAERRQIGRELTLPDVGHGVDAFTASLSALGFAPTIKRGDSGRVSFCLHNCPYADAVRENQPAVCALHRGMTLGLVDVVEPEAELADFVPHDPDEGGCVIELQGASPGAVDRDADD